MVVEEGTGYCYGSLELVRVEKVVRVPSWEEGEVPLFFSGNPTRKEATNEGTRFEWTYCEGTKVRREDTVFCWFFVSFLKKQVPIGTIRGMNTVPKVRGGPS